MAARPRTDGGLSPVSCRDATRGDITRLELDRTFDLVIAPFRVFQALETDAEVAGLMRGIREALAPDGSCILTMFNPNLPRDRMATDWPRGDEETHEWEVHTADERIICVDRRPRLDPISLALYPELVFRRYRGDTLIEEIVQPIVMRCWYPEDIESLLRDHGMSITGRWGGYAGEAWGEGPELIVQFQATGG
jgi:SAM-dependent methyltransferase